MKIEDQPITFLNFVGFSRLPAKANTKFALAGATPSVENCENWLCSGSVVTITNFLKGADWQKLYILGDGNTTIANGTKIKTNTAANKLLATNKIYTFTYVSGVWYENA